MATLKLRVKNFSKSAVPFKIEGCDPKGAKVDLAGQIEDAGVVVTIESPKPLEPGEEKTFTLVGFWKGPKELWWRPSPDSNEKGLYLYEFTWQGPRGTFPLAHAGFLGAPKNLTTETRVDLPKGDQVVELEKASDFFKES